ncbi:DUF2384 domain-containing protein [Marivibrio halodurans]|uniref:DUF2384 domain-containing protein n=1 Tax=Marivibrio halodurans TaxID=2039722 RepID=A0A8J7RYH4_9PROT|nr:MbcA/ParS/Xre antitoxin family protein [Marivibrio halodurans]MBP5855448.1 DUF2384 domain-containing protein [Marivibrio halodurans]
MDMLDPTHARSEGGSRSSPGDPVIGPEKIFDVAGIARCWSLAESEQRDLLGGVPADVFEHWRLGDFSGFTEDARGRMIRVFEIFDLLQQAVPESETADGWVRRANYDLHGRTPLSIMMEGVEGLERVRAHLAAIARDRAASIG